MTEGQFWKELRQRVNAGRSADGELPLPGYCEWFDPKNYASRGEFARITGRVLFQNYGKTERWRYTLIVNRRIPSFEEFDWAELQDVLPTDDEAGWLLVDGERLTIELPPASRNFE